VIARQHEPRLTSLYFPVCPQRLQLAFDPADLPSVRTAFLELDNGLLTPHLAEAVRKQYLLGSFERTEPEPIDLPVIPARSARKGNPDVLDLELPFPPIALPAAIILNAKQPSSGVNIKARNLLGSTVGRQAEDLTGAGHIGFGLHLRKGPRADGR